jgi:hypothetical protein
MGGVSAQHHKLEERFNSANDESSIITLLGEITTLITEGMLVIKKEELMELLNKTKERFVDEGLGDWKLVAPSVNPLVKEGFKVLGWTRRVNKGQAVATGNRKRKITRKMKRERKRNRKRTRNRKRKRKRKRTKRRHRKTRVK